MHYMSNPSEFTGLTAQYFKVHKQEGENLLEPEVTPYASAGSDRIRIIIFLSALNWSLCLSYW